jgi:hypothetical protein
MRPACLVIASLALAVLASDGASAGTMTVTSPNGGEQWRKGSTKTISWLYSGNDWPGKAVQILLWKGASMSAYIVHPDAPLTMTGQSGSYSWTVGRDHLGASSVAPGNDYTIRVRIVGTDVMDPSDAYFSITQLLVRPALTKQIVAVLAKPNLKISINLTPAACKNRTTTTCGPPTWINFPVTVSNTGSGKGTVNGTLSWRLYLYYWGQDGTQNPGNSWNAQWWTSITVPSAGASVEYTAASGSTGTTGGNQLSGHDFGVGKWILRAEVDLPPSGNTVAKRANGSSRGRFWVK